MIERIIKMCDRCDRLTKEKGKTMAVVVMDDGDWPPLARIVEESYLDTDEFEAFCGEIIYVSEALTEEPCYED